MDEKRKRAYAYLVYRALIDIRVHSWPGFRRVAWWNPFVWKKARASIRHIHLLTDYFHNLAAFLARDMEGFDEEQFWEDIRRYKLDSYRQLFEGKLAEIGAGP